MGARIVHSDSREKNRHGLWRKLTDGMVSTNRITPTETQMTVFGTID